MVKYGVEFLKLEKKTLYSLFLFNLLLFFPFVTIQGKHSFFASQKTQKYIENEKELEWDTGYPLDCTLLESRESIFINYTVLSSSLSSVRFTYYPDVRIIWTPIPPNYTLTPGESYSETFFLNGSAVDNHAMFGYVASVTEENQTATVRWGYEVLNGGILPAVDFSFTFTTLLILSASTIIFIRRKKNNP